MSETIDCTLPELPFLDLLLAFEAFALKLPDLVLDLPELPTPELLLSLFLEIPGVTLPPIVIPSLNIEIGMDFDFDIDIDIVMDIAIEFGKLVYGLVVDIPLGLFGLIIPPDWPTAMIDFVLPIIEGILTMPEVALNLATCIADLIPDLV
jgi:hypothetical protein